MDISGVYWANVGSKLETLIIHSSLLNEDELKRLRKHCNDLKHIDKSCGKCGENSEHITEFDASYGDQLNLIHVSGISEGELRQMFDLCTHARFHADVDKRHLLLPTVRILGPRLEKLKFGFFRREVDAGAWTAAWSLCPMLQVLNARALMLEETRAIMRTPKNHLKEIHICYGEYEDYEDDDFYSKPEKVMNIIATGTRDVEILFYENFIIFTRVFDKFIDKNKAILQFVTIINNGIPFRQSEADGMARKLLACPNLQSFVCSLVPGESVLKTLHQRVIRFRRPARYEKLV